MILKDVVDEVIWSRALFLECRPYFVYALQTTTVVSAWEI
jgi:hypothetical protein